MADKKTNRTQRQFSTDKFGVFTSQILELESWSQEDAEVADKDWKKQGKGHPSPLSQWLVWSKELPLLEEEWGSGIAEALLNALNLCGRFRVPLPPWCTIAISKAVNKLSSYEVRTWDDAFGANPLANRKLPDLQREKLHKIPLILDALDKLEINNPPPVTEILRSVANKHHVSYELARKWYYEYLKDYPQASALTESGSVDNETNKPPRSKE